MYDHIMPLLTATEDCPAEGQCCVTALVIQDVYGGAILKTKTGSKLAF